jgi:hypothetical protein
MAYTRAFWFGYARLFLRLVLGSHARLELAEPPPEART